MKKTNKYEQGFRITAQNAIELFDNADILANNKSYGHATALLVLAAEEAHKAMAILTKHLFPSWDGSAGYKKSFTDHKHKLGELRNASAHILMAKEMRKHFYEKNQTTNDKSSSRVGNFKTTVEEALPSQLNWWDNSKVYKEDGFYVKENVHNWHTPAQVTEKNYLTAKGNVKSILEFVYFILQMDFNDPTFQQLVSDTENIFCKNDDE